MASEPKKPIEQMLEALAKARRAQFGDDSKMPNPMRARLHEEIARTRAGEDEKAESRPSWLSMFWPRLTVAAALATLIVLVPAIWWNQSHPGAAGRSDLALRDSAAGKSDELNSAASEKDALPAVSAMTATEATVNLAENNQIKVEPAAKPLSDAERAKSSTHIEEENAAAGFPSQETRELDKEIASAKVQAAPAAVPPVRGGSKAKSDTLAAAAPPASQPSSTGTIATAQRFSRQSAFQSFRNKAQQASRTANVLNTFQVEQQGDEIRVLDADGSTYFGKIEQVTKNAEIDSRLAARRTLAKQMPKYPAKTAGEQKLAVAESYFRATGYNVSLKRTLVFEGNYAAPSQQQPASPTSNDKEHTEQSRDRARIVGTVRVNGEAPLEVDAIAEAPEPAATKKSQK